MAEFKYQLLKTQEFSDWFLVQTDVIQALVLARLHRLTLEGHFGVKNQFDGLIELKWKSGLRVYMARVDQSIIIILAGGNKNGQRKDISKAKKILNKFKSLYIRVT